MEWVEIVSKYGYKSSETEMELLNDPDVRLVPILMEKILLPKITGIWQVFMFSWSVNFSVLSFLFLEIIEKMWDPLSSTQTLRLVTLIKRLIERYPSLKPNSKNMRILLTTILNKMRLTLENDVFIPIFPKQ